MQNFWWPDAIPDAIPDA